MRCQASTFKTDETFNRDYSRIAFGRSKLATVSNTDQQDSQYLLEETGERTTLSQGQESVRVYFCGGNHEWDARLTSRCCETSILTF